MLLAQAGATLLEVRFTVIIKVTVFSTVNYNHNMFIVDTKLQNIGLVFNSRCCCGMICALVLL
jgi:hypothetical protein